jgi:hypothetical protein
MRQLQSFRVETALGPQASATTARTASIDCAGADVVTILVPVNAEANTDSTNVILDVLSSDDTVVTNHASLGTVLINNTAAHVGVYNVNINKRYLRVVATPDTTTNGAVVVGAIIAIKQVGVMPDAATTSTVRSV